MAVGCERLGEVLGRALLLPVLGRGSGCFVAVRSSPPPPLENGDRVHHAMVVLVLAALALKLVLVGAGAGAGAGGGQARAGLVLAAAAAVVVVVGVVELSLKG